MQVVKIPVGLLKVLRSTLLSKVVMREATGVQLEAFEQVEKICENLNILAD